MVFGRPYGTAEHLNQSHRLSRDSQCAVPDFSGSICFAGSRGSMTDAADIVDMQITGMCHKMTAAFLTGYELHHSSLEKSYQGPRSGNAQHGFCAFDALYMVEVQAISGNQCMHIVYPGIPDQELMDIHKQRRVDIRLPTHEPIGRVRQHSLGGRLIFDFFIHLGSLPAHHGYGFFLQQLQTRTHFNQVNCNLHLLCFTNNGFASHDSRPARLILQQVAPTSESPHVPAASCGSCCNRSPD